MNKLGKIITTGLVVASMGVIGANAETVNVGNKSYTFTEFEDTKQNFSPLVPLITYNEKLYSISSDNKILYEVEYGEKIKTKESNLNMETLNTLYGNDLYVYNKYFHDENNHKLRVEHYKLTDYFENNHTNFNNDALDPNQIETYDLEDETSKLHANNNLYYLADKYNDKLFFKMAESYDEIIVYEAEPSNNQNKYLKTIKKDDLLEKIKDDNKEYRFSSINSVDCGNDACILLITGEVNKRNSQITYGFHTFDYEENLLNSVITNDTYKYVYYDLIDNNKLKTYYRDHVDGKYYLKSSLDGDVKEIYSSDRIFDFKIFDNFITISFDNSDEQITYLYDKNMNLIKEYNDITELVIKREIDNKDDYLNFANSSDFYTNNIYNYFVKKYNDINGAYLVRALVSEETDDGKFGDIISNELLTVDNKKEVLTTKISGILKDSKGNNLKDYKIELNDLKTTTDKDGYFNFENIEEGDYKLVVKDKEDKVVLTRDLTIKNGEETKIEGDTLYFKKGEGVNLNLKLTNDNTVEIESVDEYKKHNEEVPQTLDKIFIYLGITIILGLVSYIFIIKTSKIKYLKN